MGRRALLLRCTCEELYAASRSASVVAGGTGPRPRERICYGHISRRRERRSTPWLCAEMPISSNLAIAPESFFWSLEAVSRDLRMPFSRALLVQRFPPPYDIATVQTAARALGARAELDKVSVRDIRGGGSTCFALVRTSQP